MMNPETDKCVIVVNDQLPAGLLANTAAILGMTLGKRMPELVGEDVQDRDRQNHAGIIEIPLPILKAGGDALREMRARLSEDRFAGLLTIDFSELAQRCKAYEDYTAQMAETPASELAYWGIALCGEKKAVNRLTGSLPLLR